MTADERSRLIFGTDEPAAPLQRLVAGPLSAMLDRGNLRYIRWHGFEVLRGIGFIVRNASWGTYEPAIAGLRVDEEPGRFVVAYEAACESGEGDFTYRAAIEGQAGGRLVFRAEGISRRGFRTCRTGFVVLHPLDGVVGNQVSVDHASGGRSLTSFPDLISPDQPVFDIRRLTHHPRPGLAVSVTMEGETFEMEDHRNWTDASFKTYVRPLARGYPYAIPANEPVIQAVSLDVAGVAPSVRSVGGDTVLSLGGVRGAVPGLGLFVEPAGAGAAPVAELAKLRPAYLIGRVDARGGEAAGAFADLQALATKIGCGLALQVVIAGVSPEAELAPLAALIAAADNLESIHVVAARDLRSRPSNSLPAGEADAAAILAAARRTFPGRRLGGGAPVPFAELNRNRPPPGIDFLTHATQGNVHAADDISVMETLTSLPDLIRSARAFAGDVPYRLGPSTIGVPPFTAPSGFAENHGGRRIAMASDDPRQRALFGAAFDLGLVSVAAREGLEGVTFAAVSGPAGVISAGKPTPAATLFAKLSALAGRPCHVVEWSEGGERAALAVDSGAGITVFLANLESAPITVRAPARKDESVWFMDAKTLSTGTAGWVERRLAADAILELDSYAIATATLGAPPP